MPPTCIWFVAYLMEYAFTFTFANWITGIPPTHVRGDSINRPGDLDF